RLFTFLYNPPDIYLLLHTIPTRRSSDLDLKDQRLTILALDRGRWFGRRRHKLVHFFQKCFLGLGTLLGVLTCVLDAKFYLGILRSEEHTSELQSQSNLVCRLLLENKNVL